jgi:transposase
MTNIHKPDPKGAALDQSGTTNPHPDSVRDVAFSGSDFFDPRDLLQVRYEMLRRVRTERMPIAEAAVHFGVSRPTFYKAAADFERAGLVGLLPAKRGPHGAHKLTDEVMRFIQEMHEHDPGLHTQDLTDRIADHFGLRVHRRSVERALARAKKKPRRQPITPGRRA